MNDFLELANEQNQKEIANIYAVCFEDIKKAIKIYKSLEPQLKNDANYWFQLSSLYEYNNNYYMKIETANYPEDCSIQVNAVNLKNGQLARFLSDNQIYFLDAEMTVTRRDMSSYEQ